ncbi:CMD domain protein [Microbacterium sp.]|uniref:CMD domain protein n=1 Tax=Microbacterium sp. TaxID=51671 RepID=UPI0039E4B702
MKAPSPAATRPRADIIDLLAHVAPGGSLDAVRARRSQARENAQRSFEVLLEPADPGSFPLAQRYAVAAFVAQLHGLGAEFYRDLLADEAPELVEAVARAAGDGERTGPYGRYREPGLVAESVAGDAWTPDAALAALLGERLSAALAHAQLLVYRPRESSPGALAALVAAGWSADDIVTLSQLVAFLSFQLRTAWGLRVLGAAPAGRDGEGRTR